MKILFAIFLSSQAFATTNVFQDHVKVYDTKSDPHVLTLTNSRDEFRVQEKSGVNYCLKNAWLSNMDVVLTVDEDKKQIEKCSLIGNSLKVPVVLRQ